ncbi:hypothetical protein N0V93_003751 [Gnomoniopsis smithogilvyi]|uniref:Protein kinase domain-containing protein n=1 Tax=Gnomoniopsis smithogilvyi TaxID=1191159 RepID=A0A9W8YXP7_9PEZI|nr:hypothetical protein N0V93_003751 [Gnomoniopsis smithogilvyi]
MDLSTRTIHDVIHPTAVFYTPATTDSNSIQDPVEDVARLWEDSQLNPKNRIDSLDPPKHPLWKIDGCAGLGTQFYAVPLFLGDVPPIRCDALLSEDVTEDPAIRKLLDLDTVFHARDRARLQRQGIYSYVLRALQAWTENYGREKVRELYYESPFGSRLVFGSLPLKVEDVDIQVRYHWDLESHYNTVDELKKMWEGQVDVKSIPLSVDIFDLIFVQQLHDSVCVVRYRQDADPNNREPKTAGLWVLKALTSSVKFMYHELRVLLTMPAHPNIISPPVRLVTKATRMNRKRTAVVGFLMPFHPGGGLRDELPLLRVNHLLNLQDQMRWARDICSGMLHIRSQAHTFYPDLRLDQIVFPADKKRPIIVDLEQRGVWCEFGSPEVNAIDYLMALAIDEGEDDDDDATHTESESQGLSPSRQRSRDIMLRLHPKYKRLCNPDDIYDNPPMGYNIPWICLNWNEQEYAMVYMLGRLLWCIFEGMSAPQRGAIWQSYHNEPEFEFPEFRRTPPELRSLIDQCTRGRRSQLSNCVVRKGSKIVLRDDPRGHGTPAQIRSVAKIFWANEVRWAEEFLLDREKQLKEGSWDDNHFGRPTLTEVDEALATLHFKLYG